MVKLRLTRIGRKGKPFYRIIAIQDRDKRDGRAIEQIGTYDPMTKPSTIKLENDRIKYWLSVGAQPTDTVARILAREGLYEFEVRKHNDKPGKKAQERGEKKKADSDSTKEEKEAAPTEKIKQETESKNEEKQEDTKEEQVDTKKDDKK